MTRVRDAGVGTIAVGQGTLADDAMKVGQANLTLASAMVEERHCPRQSEESARDASLESRQSARSVEPFTSRRS
ncbi:Hypothetical protein A7982_05482 [Minicystis rosea]|nr:Hypothetical protein A7982_05482 [Minicystis rosea]